MDEIPSEIGRYQIDGVVGRGGTGVVYRATDPSIRRTVAIKLLEARGPEVEQRFLTEVQTAGNLSHPNIAKMFDVGRTESGKVFIVQEFIDGVDLARVIQAHPNGLPAATAIGLLVQIAQALGHAHSRGVVHRDVKPGNVAVLEDGTAKLLDFGIARIEHTDMATTIPGTIVGTPQYMAPEQVRGEVPTASVDIFSFGVLAYELLGGGKPFDTGDLITTVTKVLNEPVPPLQQLADPAHHGLASLINECLAKQPSERPASMEQVAERLAGMPKEWDSSLISSLPARAAAPPTTSRGLPTPAITIVGAPAPPPSVRLFAGNDLTGQQVGRFMLHERIARGKSGDLYKAWDPVRSCLVGAKVVHATDAQARNRLLRGGRVWLALNHPHIVKVHEVHPDYGGLPGLIIAELVEGSNLDELVAQRHLDLEQIMWIVFQLCDALAAIHALNVVHREIKPRNILISGDHLHVTLLDSGIARNTNPEVDAFTKTGVFVGDLAYAAPELAGGRSDQRSDIYAVVAVLYELVTQSRLPFPMPRDWAPQAETLAGFPQRLREVITRGLQADPGGRFSSVTELQDQLRPMVVDREPAAPARSVVALHGIRTHAAWQRAFAEVAGRRGLHTRFDRWNFGYFSVFQFLMPWARLAKVKWFRRTYETESREAGWGQTRPSIVAHSFGTYILGNALLRYPYLRFDKVLLCGSILPRDFPWDRLIERGQVQAVRNEYGSHDVWTQSVAWFVPATGPSGLLGFDATHKRLQQERFDFEHSEYFDRGHMDHRWMPFLCAEIEQLPTREIDVEPSRAAARPWGLYSLYLGLALAAAGAAAFWLN